MAKISAQITEEDHGLLCKITAARGEGISTFVRRALRREFGHLGYLAPEEAKALEVGYDAT